ncbi:hypothetical protein EYC84_009239 [Monilinia fructicola]|uniref:Glutamate decarboxylase n=1 Tax=Monilinia fructicola TaxID=38448 RepID=A0A5M9JG59_MONFR|nr:hypothetical protein EYC84_009239 [Monilinia fructicola]
MPKQTHHQGKDINVSDNQNGQTPLNRADEVEDHQHTGHGKVIPGEGPRTTLLEHHDPEKLVQLLDFNLPNHGKGKDGLLSTVEQVLKYSVNTWDQGFLDKLYASTNAVGVISELILAVLNTNLHVYHVSPALTVIEKTTARAFANLYGFDGPHAGGISTQGGSASNTTSIIIARNNLFPRRGKPAMHRMNSCSLPPPMGTTPWRKPRKCVDSEPTT